MTPPADQLDQAFENQQQRFQDSLQGSTCANSYAIAYCSGDGTIEIKEFKGRKDQRIEMMQALGVDPLTNHEYAFVSWDTRENRWSAPHSGKGEREQDLFAALTEWKAHHFIPSK